MKPENSNAQAPIVPGNTDARPVLKKNKKPGLRGNHNNPKLAELGKPYRWQKGCPSPNPSGRPKTPITDALREGVGQRYDGLTVAQKMAEAQIREALKGSLPHFHEIRLAIEGPPTQTIDYGPLQGVMEAEPGPPRVQELMKRMAAIMIERSKAYDMALPEFAQEIKAEMEAEAAAGSGDDGKPSQKAMMFGDGMSLRDGFVATMSH